MKEILESLKNVREAPDILIAVGRGGIIPAAIVAKQLELDMAIIWIRQYNDEMPPKRIYDAPKLTKPFDADVSGKRVLIVDDISRSGKTLDAAKSEILKHGAKEVKTLVFVGRGADIVLFQTDACAEFPWQD